MKKNIFYSLSVLLTGAALTLTSCSEDDLSPNSVITVDNAENTLKTDFDRWLDVNLLQPYNIEFKYRYEYNESDKNFYTVPADYEQSIELAKIVKYTCVDTYNEVAGVDFTRKYFPKMFFLVGEWEYKNNGTAVLGTAENGKKIILSGVNHLDKYLTSLDNLNEYYLKTIHHEFTHILNQTQNYSAAFQLVTSSGYVADSWSSSPYNVNYLQRGFISDYAQYSHTEDFAEMMSLYVVNTPEQWNAWMKEAGETGSALLNQKLLFVRQYMQDSYNIDIDKLRTSILRRETDVINGKVDLKDITIK